jgi:hypothetical protein
LADVLPEPTVTLAGTDATAELLDKEMERSSLDGAGPFRITVPVEEVPPVGPGGLSVRSLMAGPRSDNATPGLDPAIEIVTEVVLTTCLVVTVTVTVDAPAGTGTLHGAGFPASAGLLLERVTLVPEGAGPFRVTVQRTGSPPTTMALSHASDEAEALVTDTQTSSDTKVK